MSQGEALDQKNWSAKAYQHCSGSFRAAQVRGSPIGSAILVIGFLDAAPSMMPLGMSKNGDIPHGILQFLPIFPNEVKINFAPEILFDHIS
jgi:hypothetical protein